MMRELVVSDEATSGQEQIAEYIFERFGEETGDAYLQSIESAFQTIRKSPELFQKVGYKGLIIVHKYVLNKRTIILYHFDNE
jgi:plasmid stabilization system protein ParE